jgi:hypothetical protein
MKLNIVLLFNSISKEKRMRLATLTCLGLLIVGGAQAQTIGVPACDEFLTKSEACSAKVPALKGMVDQMKGAWTEAAKDASAKGDLEAMCKQTAEQMKASMKPHGCSF